jgi:hypothetical protein
LKLIKNLFVLAGNTLARPSTGLVILIAFAVHFEAFGIFAFAHFSFRFSHFLLISYLNIFGLFLTPLDLRRVSIRRAVALFSSLQSQNFIDVFNLYRKDLPETNGLNLKPIILTFKHF